METSLEISISEISKDDITEVDKLLQQLSRYSPSDEILMEGFKKILNHDVYACVCKQNEIIIGVGFIYFLPKLRGGIVGQIEDIAVCPDFHRRGIGNQIISHLLEIAKAKGCYSVSLYCKESNVSFYEKQGFQRFEVSMRLKLI